MSETTAAASDEQVTIYTAYEIDFMLGLRDTENGRISRDQIGLRSAPEPAQEFVTAAVTSGPAPISRSIRSDTFRRASRRACCTTRITSRANPSAASSGVTVVSSTTTPSPPGSGAVSEAKRQLAMLCRTVVEEAGALRRLAAFLARRVPEPAGARVLGCVLQLAGREDGARFWWQFAAGAGDGAAAFCLYLHHLTLGEEWEAELWHRQSPEPPGDDGCGPELVLRVLTGLRNEDGGDGDTAGAGDDGTGLTAAATAVVHYVPGAVAYVDECELPLPEAGFARRIEELTATA